MGWVAADRARGPRGRARNENFRDDLARLVIDCHMSLRLHGRLRLAPGISLNLGKSGLTSLSFGARGAHYTVGRRGPRATIGLPGTGLSYTMTPHRHVRQRRRRHASLIGWALTGLLLYVIWRIAVG